MGWRRMEAGGLLGRLLMVAATESSKEGGLDCYGEVRGLVTSCGRTREDPALVRIVTE